MNKVIFIMLISFSVVVLVIFLKEGRNDEQSLDSVMEVIGQTTRDMAETSTSVIKISTAEENEIGRQIFESFQVLPDDNDMVVRVREIGNRFLPYRLRVDINYRFYVTNQRFVNAFALPGGYIIITAGMVGIVENDDELAWVIGHEISHIEKRHAIVQLKIHKAKQKIKIDKNRRLNKLATTIERLYRVGYSENMELEADISGLRLMLNADYDCRAAIRLVDYMASKNPQPRKNSRNFIKMGIKLSQKTLRAYFSTHPHWNRRKEAILKDIKK
ncbi:M48 family metallopeptidase [Candidatus Uabimicrobium sp. HlEnr_7]|uniref:M48 family metallopeptidase n=1 Tax=Candidatus Uabimicrobium helgolandensis TaxID=3095367 RepID=UPI003558D220